MRHAIATVLAVLFCWAACRASFAAASDLKSGPQPGESIPGPFHYLNVNGPHAENPHCLVCEFGLRPTVLVFVREIPTDRSPIMELIQKLDGAVDRWKNAELRAGVVVLNEDFTKAETRKGIVRKLESATRELKHVRVAVGGAAGPESYRINKDADVTVLLYNKQRVVDNFARPKEKFTDKDVAAIVTAVNKMIKAK